MAKKSQVDETETEDAGQPESARPVGIVAKVFELQSRIGTFTKDAKNAHFKYQFASATGINEAVKPILRELGLVAQVQTSVDDVNASGLVLSKTILTLIDADYGDFKNGLEDGVNALSFTSIGSGIDSGDKAAMKAATASQKYATIAMAFGATVDDPEADAKTDIRSSAPAQAEKPASTRSNRAPAPAPAGEAAEKQGPVDIGNGQKVITVGVDKVYDGRPSERTGMTGPGTVVSLSGHKFDTFDKELLGIARKAKAEGKKVNIMYTYNEQFKRNSIVEDGLSIFGEVAQQGETREQHGEEGDAY